MHADKSVILSQGPWAELPESLSCQLKELVRPTPYAKGSVLYRAGDPARGLFFVFEGLVGLFSGSEEGREHLLRIFGRGVCLGHRALVADEPHQGEARVLETSKIGLLEAERAHQLLRESPEFAAHMMKKLAVELRRAEHRLASAIEKQVAARIAETLIYLKDSFPDHRWTRNDIAYYSGSTGPTVIRTLAFFESEGLIQQEGRDIVIQDLKKLAEVAG